jgi:hypothetical protein
VLGRRAYTHSPRTCEDFALLRMSGRAGAGGTTYDLASAILGGATGHELRGGAFKRAYAYVADVLGEEVSS